MLKAQPHSSDLTSNHRRQSQVQVVACASDSPAVNWKPHGSLLWFMNLREWLKELRKTVYLLGNSLSYEDVTQEQPNERDTQSKVCWKECGASIHSLVALPPRYLHVFISLEVLLTRQFGFFKEGSLLHRHE